VCDRLIARDVLDNPAYRGAAGCRGRGDKCPFRRSWLEATLSPSSPRSEVTHEFHEYIPACAASAGAKQNAIGADMLGIIIGVGAVIAVVSIGQGAQYMVSRESRPWGRMWSSLRRVAGAREELGWDMAAVKNTHDR